MSFVKLVKDISVDAALAAIRQASLYRVEQTNTSTNPAVGVVESVNGSEVVVVMPDNTKKTVTIGYRFLNPGDMTVVYGGMAN